MTTTKEIKEHLELALKEIGTIEPWFDKSVNEWIFSHKNYPIEYGGESIEKVIENYPEYLREFIKQRLNANLNPLTEKKTKGHGGKRVAAGRPKGSVKEDKERISLPRDIVYWFKHDPKAIDYARKKMRRSNFV